MSKILPAANWGLKFSGGFLKMELLIMSHLGGPENTTLYPFFRVLISGHVRACILTYNALLLHSSVEQYLEEEVKAEICRTG